MRSLLTIGLAILMLCVVKAQPPKEKSKDIPEALPRIAARSPEESAKQFEIHTGFKIELAAAEPLVMSPVAAEFDEDGRLYVVELPEYNQYGSTKPHGKGRVVRLDDTDGDGKFDKRTIVVDGLDYPTAVFPWDGGIYVGAAPDLLYCKNGEKKVILTGFGKDRAGEGQLNSIRWTLENRLLICTGIDGGEIVRPAANGEKPITVRGLNILLDPRTNTIETTSGGGQHGLAMDNWGNTFVCGNSDPCHHLVYDTRYLTRNPAVIAPPASINIAPGGKYTKLHRISETEPWRALRTRLRKDGIVPGSDEGGTPSGFFTGATGITVYRGDAFPKEFRENVFVGEVANNLVFRAKLVPKGVTFTAERADPDKEFLASKDIWFRPVQFTHGPDGCLYVLDMYRELIEGAAFLAPPILKHVDPSAGVDMGRIWRIAPKEFKQPKLPKISNLSTAELVNLLDHSNGWHRDSAARLLYQRQDPQSVEPLKKLAADSKSPLGRVHALAALRGLNALTIQVLQPRLKDPHTGVRQHALRMHDQLKFSLADQTIVALAKDDDARVRYELAWMLSRSDSDAVGKALQTIIKRDLADPWIRLAVLTAATSNEASFGPLDFIADPEVRKTPGGKAFVEALIETAGASRNQTVALAALRGVSMLREQDVGFQVHLLGVLLRRASPEIMRYLQKNRTAQDLFKQLHERAHELALDTKADDAERASAIRSLSTIPFDEARTLCTQFLRPTQSRAVQIAALDLLNKIGGDKVPEVILSAWPSLSPQVRASATEVFLSRAAWVEAFLDAVEQRKIARGDVDPARIALLMKSPNRAVRVRVEELFKGVGPGKRKDVIDAYQKALAIKGDALKGKMIFKKECSACHKLEDVGNEVGADIRAIRDRGVENMMLNILDPNREVKPQFLAYTLETSNGKTFSGMITAETPNSVTIRLLDGRSEIVARADIDKLRSTGLSFMPEGFEKQIDVNAMADLLAYLNSIK